MDGRHRRRRRNASVPRHVPRGQPALDCAAQPQHGVGGRGRARVAQERGLFAAVRQGARAGAAGRARRARRQAAHVPLVPLLLRARLRRSCQLADVLRGCGLLRGVCGVLQLRALAQRCRSGLRRFLYAGKLQC
jgi:hypothetical protein